MNGVGDAEGQAGRAATPRVPGLVLLRRLGAGGHGEVWLAADLATGDRVAVKIRHRAGDADGTGAGSAERSGEGADRLAREIALLRRIDDPHVVRLRRVVDLPDGARALVMDLAAGGSLGDLVAVRGPLEAPEACTVVVPLARTLAALHGRGLVHGDLTPDNVLFTADGRPMITDLGCAVVLGDRPGEIWGSDGYCDPARTGPATPADDVFALGALLRFALTGDPAASVGRAGADRATQALLELADLCSAATPGRRPAPEEVASGVLAATPAVPVRLLRSVLSKGLSAGPGAGGPGAGGPGRSTPRIEPGGLRPPGPSAARQGWTRAAGPPAGASDPADPAGPAGPSTSPARGAAADATPTAATILPVTSVDLGLPEHSGDRAGVAVTRRRPGVGPDSGGAQRAVTRSGGASSGWSRQARSRSEGSRLRPDAEPRGVSPAGRVDGRRPAQHRRLRARPADPESLDVRAGSASRRQVVIGALLAVGAGVAWLVLDGGGRPDPALARAPAAGSPAIGSPASNSPVLNSPAAGSPAAAGPVPGTPGPATAASAPASLDPVREPIGAAVIRLARGRAAAFGEVSIEGLHAVNEPGSPALTADTALVSRLAAEGLRLEGLTFEVSGVRQVSRVGDTVTIEATVATSAHRQVGLRDGAVRVAVPASPPRRVRLTLVAAPDGRHWLIRSTDSPA